MERRQFVRAAAAGGVFATTALAGCGGQQGEETPDGEGEDGDTPETTAGEPLPEYRYLNNPANYNAARHDAINLIAEQLSEAGFRMSVDVFEWGTLYERATQEFDFGFTTWNRGLGIYPGTRMPEQYHSSNAEPGGGNFTGYVNEDLDPMLFEQLEASSVQERVDILYDIQEVLAEDVPMHPIVQMPNVIAFNNEQVQGFTDHIVGYYHFEPMTNVEVTADHGELRGSWSETLGTLNVLGYNNETKLIQQFEMLYDKLVRNNANVEPDPELSLADDWGRPSEDSVRYVISDEHTWHDGQDLTPQDVRFTLEYIKENQVPLYATQWELIDSVEVDGQEVTVNFTSAVGPVHQIFSNQIPIVPEHIWSEISDPNNATVTEPVGSGPLQFDYWDQGSELGLVSYDDHPRSVNFDRRIWRIIPEASTVWSLLNSGDLNYLPFSRIGRQLNENQENDQITVNNTAGDGWWHISQNTRQEGLEDPAVRRAAVMAVPKQVVNEQLLYGFAEPGYNLIGESFGQYHNPDVPAYQPDDGIAAAREELESAGYGFNEDGNIVVPE